MSSISNEATDIFNRTVIMKTTWAHYRDMTRLRRAGFDRKLFADMPRSIWLKTKRRARVQAETEARRARAIAEFARILAAPLAPLSVLEQCICGSDSEAAGHH